MNNKVTLVGSWVVLVILGVSLLVVSSLNKTQRQDIKDLKLQVYNLKETINKPNREKNEKAYIKIANRNKKKSPKKNDLVNNKNSQTKQASAVVKKEIPKTLPEKIVKNKEPASIKNTDNDAYHEKVIAELKQMDVATRRKKLGAIIGSMRSQYDKKNKITWYYDRSTPKNTAYDSFHLYLGKGVVGKWLRMKIQYAASAAGILDINKYVFLIDGQRHELNIDPKQIKKSQSKGKVSEWIDIVLDNKTRKVIEKAVTSKNAYLRYIGKKGYKDRKLSKEERAAISNVLDADNLLTSLVK